MESYADLNKNLWYFPRNNKLYSALRNAESSNIALRLLMWMWFCQPCSGHVFNKNGENHILLSLLSAYLLIRRSLFCNVKRRSLCYFQYRRIGMLAAGTGIAPMLQVIQGIVDNEEDETFIHLVYSSRTYEDILMKEDLDNMTAYWNFSVLYVISKVCCMLYFWCIDKE